ncbi:hypothetical protein Hanom_Chr14g01278311 [Helianthus anomalus]
MQNKILKNKILKKKNTFLPINTQPKTIFSYSSSPIPTPKKKKKKHGALDRRGRNRTCDIDAQRTLQRGQTAYWGRAFQRYQQHVGNTRHNLNVCQHKWRELKPKLNRFKVCFNRVPAGDLIHDDRVEILKIEYMHVGNTDFNWVLHFNIYRTRSVFFYFFRI